MIVLKHNGIVYIATSQCFQGDMDAVRTGKVNPENLKAYHPQGRKNQLMATETENCVSEAIRYEKVFPKELNVKSLVLDVFPYLAQISRFFHRSEKGHCANNVVFAKDSEAYVLYGDGTCLEVEEIYADTEGMEIPIAVYDAQKVDDPIEFFRNAFATHEEIHGGIMFPVAVLNTANTKIKVINREK